jgi:hypothetical protein
VTFVLEKVVCVWDKLDKGVNIAVVGCHFGLIESMIYFIKKN